MITYAVRGERWIIVRGNCSSGRGGFGSSRHTQSQRFTMTAQRHILIVEDDDSIRMLVEHVARRAGYATSSATHGADAIRALGSDAHFCAVVLDLMMPSVSGYDVIMHIRDNNLHVPVIVATAVVRGLEHERLDPQIVRAILTKPFDIDKLRSAITDACASH